MKNFLKLSFAACLCLVGATALSQEDDSNFSSAWTCKTSPMWNGRSSYPRFATASTQEQAWAKAANFCRFSGQESYCRSAITCWEQ